MKAVLALVLATFVVASLATTYFEDDFTKDGTQCDIIWNVSVGHVSPIASFLGFIR